LAASLVRLDETGFRIGGKTCWLHNVSTARLTHYRVPEKRGAVPADLGGGIVVHDHFKPYYALPELQHALCNAHHLRELKALMEFEREPWAEAMSQFLLAANKRVAGLVKQGEDALADDLWAVMAREYDEIPAQGFEFHAQQTPLVRQPGARGKPPRGVGHDLLIRLRDFKQDVLRFATNFAVPFTSNQAERDIRMMKLKMKISGGFRSFEGAKLSRPYGPSYPRQAGNQQARRSARHLGAWELRLYYTNRWFAILVNGHGWDLSRVT
jgi:transposase